MCVLSHQVFLSSLPEHGLRVVYDALAGVVVGVGEEDVPVFGQGVGVDGEPVVLTGDEAAVCSLVDAGLVVATVTVPDGQEDREVTHLVAYSGSC